MSYDGVLLRHVLNDLSKTLKGGRIHKIYQIDDLTFLFNVRTNTTHTLLISASKQNARIHLTRESYDKPYNPPMFCMFLRKHLEGGFIKDVKQHKNDRLAVFTVKHRNELGDFADKHLIVELFGKDANIALTDDNHKILDALNHVGAFETERTMVGGAKYSFPEDNRIDPFTDKLPETLRAIQSDNHRDYLKQIQGVSPLFLREFLHRRKQANEDEVTIFEQLLQEENPHMVIGKRIVFASFDPTHVEGERTSFESLHAMLDHVYTARDRESAKRQQAKQLTSFVQKQLDKQTTKLERLQKTLSETDNIREYQTYGELILAYQHTIEKGDRRVRCHDYYSDQEITLELDPKKTPVENSRLYFDKAKKLKKSVPHLRRQIRKTKREREYFRMIESQLEHASLDDLHEIKDELREYGYLKKRPERKTPKKQTKNFLLYEDNDGAEIMVGKNNRQNAIVTHKEAKHYHVWFHVKDAPGSHVVVKRGFPLSETTIRSAAHLAAYYSKMRHSGSVPVDYTEVKNIKKIPGQKPCFVTYTNQKTIYIDPSEETVENMKQLK